MKEVPEMMPRAELVGMFLAVLVASVIVLLVILGAWQLAELLVEWTTP